MDRDKFEEWFNVEYPPEREIDWLYQLTEADLRHSWKAAMNSLDGYIVNNPDGTTTIYRKKDDM